MRLTKLLNSWQIVFERCDYIKEDIVYLDATYRLGILKLISFPLSGEKLKGHYKGFLITLPIKLFNS